MGLTSNDPQTLIRTARKEHRCDCRLPAHEHPGGEPVQTGSGRWCPNVIRPGEQYPEYVGEVANFQTGSRYCPTCRTDQLGDWISEPEIAS